MARRTVPTYPGSERVSRGRKSGKPNAWVKALQGELLSRGFKGFEQSSRWDLPTKRAVRRLQKRKGLTPDGIPGPATWAALFGKASVPFVGSGHEKHPFVWLRPGVRPAGDGLMQRANAIGKVGYEKHGKRLVVISGNRPCGSPNDAVGASTQWGLWKLYKAGRGNLAAVPCTSNHGSGRALDLGWEDKNGGNYTSFLNLPWARALAKQHGVCFPVPREPWHMQIGTLFRV